MTEAHQVTDPSRNGPKRDVIDGSQVITREVARLFVPASKEPDKLSPCTGIEQVLLEDGRVVYQCDAAVEPKCNYWNEKGESVRAHLRAHSEKTQYKIEQLKAERDALLAQQQRRAENYANGARKAAATKKMKREQGLYANDIDNEEQAGMTSEELRKELDRLTLMLEGMQDGLATVNTVISNIGKSAENAASRLAELSDAEFNIVNPEIAEKAAKWDSFQELVGKLPSTK